MRKQFWRTLLAVLMVGLTTPGQASLVGPWFRFDCTELGFQMPVANGWKVTTIPNGLVFAMQYAPQPYVRVAIGRVPADQESLETLIANHAKTDQATPLRRINRQIDGCDAVEIEGHDPLGPYRELFVKKGPYYYWIGFAAGNESSALWPEFSQTFDIIIEGFRFI